MILPVLYSLYPSRSYIVKLCVSVCLGSSESPSARGATISRQGLGPTTPKGGIKGAASAGTDSETTRGTGSGAGGFGAGLTVSTLLSPKSAAASGFYSPIAASGAPTPGRATGSLSASGKVPSGGLPGVGASTASGSEGTRSIVSSPGAKASQTPSRRSAQPQTTSATPGPTGTSTGTASGLEDSELEGSQPEQLQAGPGAVARGLGPGGARLPPRVGPGDRSRPRNFTRLALPLVLPEHLLAPAPLATASVHAASSCGGDSESHAPAARAPGRDSDHWGGAHGATTSGSLGGDDGRRGARVEPLSRERSGSLRSVTQPEPSSWSHEEWGPGPGPEVITLVEVAVASQNAVGWSDLSGYSYPVVIRRRPSANAFL
jgi:hypothetical protein